MHRLQPSSLCLASNIFLTLKTTVSFIIGAFFFILVLLHIFLYFLPTLIMYILKNINMMAMFVVSVALHVFLK